MLRRETKERNSTTFAGRPLTMERDVDGQHSTSAARKCGRMSEIILLLSTSGAREPPLVTSYAMLATSGI